MAVPTPWRGATRNSKETEKHNKKHEGGTTHLKYQKRMRVENLQRFDENRDLFAALHRAAKSAVVLWCRGVPLWRCGATSGHVPKNPHKTISIQVNFCLLNFKHNRGLMPGKDEKTEGLFSFVCFLHFC